MILRNPVNGRISPGFGMNPEIYKSFDLAGHEGVDYSCRIGTSVFSAYDGFVWRAGETSNPWGTRIIIRHDYDVVENGISRRHMAYTVYAHLSAVFVMPMDFVREGQEIGLSGNTGNSTGPHLHFAFATTQKNDGYKCPPSMGVYWWQDPAPYFAGVTRGIDKVVEDMVKWADSGDCTCVPADGFY